MNEALRLLDEPIAPSSSSISHSQIRVGREERRANGRREDRADAAGIRRRGLRESGAAAFVDLLWTSSLDRMD